MIKIKKHFSTIKNKIQKIIKETLKKYSFQQLKNKIQRIIRIIKEALKLNSINY